MRIRNLFLLFVLVVLLVVGCKNTTQPTAPTVQADLPTWTITVDAVDYTIGPADLMRDRMAQVVDPGTDMTTAELRVYFAVNIVKTNFPPFYQCAVYKIFYSVMLAQTDQFIWRMVQTMEYNGYDVPNKGPGVPPPPIC